MLSLYNNTLQHSIICLIDETHQSSSFRSGKRYFSRGMNVPNSDLVFLELTEAFIKFNKCVLSPYSTVQYNSSVRSRTSNITPQCMLLYCNRWFRHFLQYVKLIWHTRFNWIVVIWTKRLYTPLYLHQLAAFVPLPCNPIIK